MKKTELAVRGVLALVALSSGLFDFAAPEPLIQSFTRLGVPLYYLPFFGALKVAGALGLWSAPVVKTDVLRIGAQWGLVFYFLGAGVTHVLAGDGGNAPTPFVLTVLAVASLVLSLRTAEETPAMRLATARA